MGRKDYSWNRLFWISSNFTQCGWSECPRDSIQQCEQFCGTVDIDPEISNLRRGDIIFWEGHVAIYVQTNKIIHSNMTSMDVRIENFTKIREILDKEDNHIKSVARMIPEFIYM